jgi:hypothetical protein
VAPPVGAPPKWAEVVVEFDGVVVEPDSATPSEIPVTATASAVAEIHRLLRLESNRRATGSRRGVTSGGMIGSLSLMMTLLLLRQLRYCACSKGWREELSVPSYRGEGFFKIWYRRPADNRELIFKKP